VGHRRPEGGGRRPWGWPGRAGAHHSEDAGSGWRLVDDRLLGGEEVVLRLVNLSGQGIGRGTLVLQSKGRRADLLLGRDSLGLGSNESHGESAVGCSGTGRRRDRAQHAEGRDDVRKTGKGWETPCISNNIPHARTHACTRGHAKGSGSVCARTRAHGGADNNRGGGAGSCPRSRPCAGRQRVSRLRAGRRRRQHPRPRPHARRWRRRDPHPRPRSRQG
jgi:hypothetical protein